MSLLQRIRARVVYQAWFYAPQITGRQSVERLTALGFTWRAPHWIAPDAGIFVQRMRNQ